MSEIGEQILMVTSGAREFAKSLRGLQRLEIPRTSFDRWLQRLPEEIEDECGEELLRRLHDIIKHRLEKGTWQE
jgi:hypothetical protein